MTNEVELIPDEDKVYLRVSGNLFEGQEYSPSIIRQQGGDGISVDWSHYSEPEDCLRRGKVEKDGVVSFNAGCVRALHIPIEDMPSHLSVVHKPEPDNQAHSLIVRLPDKKRKIEIKMIRNLVYSCINLEIHCPTMVDNLSKS